MLIQCVLGALGLAIEQATFHPSDSAPSNHFESPVEMIERRKKTLRRRLESLADLRQRIERFKLRFEMETSAKRRSALQKALLAREELYQKRMAQLRRSRNRLTQFERELRLHS
ncbi:hypothetical protein BH10PLA2_BH10PLA2_34370 [soil metagenome]